MKFLSNEVDLLASVGKDGNIFVWKIFEIEADASLSYVVTPKNKKRLIQNN